MDTNKVYEEIFETTEEIATESSGRFFKVAAGVGLTVLVGVVTYKYVIKPIVTKLKTKEKEQQMIDEVEIDE